MKGLPSLLLVWVVVGLCGTAVAQSPPVPEILPVKGTVTMIDLGGSTCIPCRMMAPILAELETEYQGRAAIIYIDVWKQPGEAKKFKALVIPTQIFFDRNGKEVFRNSGFLDKKAIVAELTKLGLAAPAAGAK